MTVLGQYTIAELQDLIAAKDVETQAVATAYAGFAGQWATSDPASQQAWLADWSKLYDAYQAARASGEAEIAIADAKFQIVPDNLDTDGDAPYRAILSALQPVEGVTSPGDFQDLYGRLTAAMGAPIPEPPVPQPRAGTDVDLNVYNQTGQVLKVLGKPASDWEPIAIGAGVALAGVILIKALV